MKRLSHFFFFFFHKKKTQTRQNTTKHTYENKIKRAIQKIQIGIVDKADKNYQVLACTVSLYYQVLARIACTALWSASVVLNVLYK